MSKNNDGAQAKLLSERYKNTLNLPATDFPMKANLPQLEPNILKRWEEMGLYERVQQWTADKPKFILHDGPPYANGAIHIGHALNIVLKDMVVKSKIMSGFNSPFVPGWDCHGLPIELNVEKKYGKPGDKLDPKSFRQKCREYVNTQVDLQRNDFVRLGVLGDWKNPYLTMDPLYEANIIRSLSKIVQKNHVQKGYKPVHWCIECGSALAEAEVEYRNKTSLSLDVCFEVVEPHKLPSAFRVAINGTNAKPSLVIWTTTPWTLPANEAVTVHPTHQYALVKYQDREPDKNNTRWIIIVSELVSAVMNRYGIDHYEVLAECVGAALEHLQLQHPFYNRQVPVILGEHVTLDTGTGCVHTAPAHGQEDYQVALRYHLPIENPVGPNGCFIEGTPELAGQHINKANEKIVELLETRGNLLHQAKFEHSYPHCWRHKTPLIFRATQQWFISMEKEHLRDSALQAIKKVKWIPTWGEGRIAAMIEGRPDWCISRQRTWGVPLCLVTHKKTGALHPQIAEIMEAVAKKVEKIGIDAWFEGTLEEFLPRDAADPTNNKFLNINDEYEKSIDTLDVWFDSGVSHFCVLEQRPELSFPADLYLEGSDQHRGWFQSSLLTSIAMKEIAPYREVLTHGFMVDMEGHKMSKSLGNVLAPEKVIVQMGADILRLWVSGTDYRTEIAVSEELLKRSGDAYRRIRNTARFLLANLNGFDPMKHALPANKLIKLDQWILRQTQLLQDEIIEAYAAYQFHLVHQKIHHFCSILLGSFYLDIIKDRQYTGKEDGLPRRSAQTTLFHIMEALVRWMAPILSFTSEEIWKYMPGDRSETVFLNEWYQHFPAGLEEDPVLNDQYFGSLLQLREVVNKALEESRTAGLIGSGLEAEVNLYCPPDLYSQLKQLGDELRFLLITSRADIYTIDNKPQDATETSFPGGLWLEVLSSKNSKCVRCWHRREDVNTNSEYPGLCSRCVENAFGNGEVRQFA